MKTDEQFLITLNRELGSGGRSIGREVAARLGVRFYDKFLLESLVKEFHLDADEIEKLYEQGDLENYTIKVHALKSSARIIGAAELSDQAKELELAGKRKDTDYIRQNTEALLNNYRALDERLQNLDRSADGRPLLSEDMRREAFQTMAEIAESMDFGMMENLLQDLRKYELSPEDTNTLKQIEGMLMELDWDEIEKTVRAAERFW